MKRISFDILHAEFRRVLLENGFTEERGDRFARDVNRGEPLGLKFR